VIALDQSIGPSHGFPDRALGLLGREPGVSDPGSTSSRFSLPADGSPPIRYPALRPPLVVGNCMQFDHNRREFISLLGGAAAESYLIRCLLSSTERLAPVIQK
jgi:hypothetical protein